MRSQLKLKEGTIVIIEPLNGKEDAREFQRFINTLTKEKTYLLVDKPVSLKEERQWLKTQLQEHRKGQQIYLKALRNGRLIAVCVAQTGFGRNHGNVNLGIAIAKPWRGKGLGYLLLTELIERSEQKWHPKNIYLHVISANTTAHRLYETLGFHIIATLPDWFEYEKKYLDEYFLILDKVKFFQQKKIRYDGSKKR